MLGQPQRKFFLVARQLRGGGGYRPGHKERITFFERLKKLCLRGGGVNDLHGRASKKKFAASLILARYHRSDGTIFLIDRLTLGRKIRIRIN